jgi:hypothetical protein
MPLGIISATQGILGETTWVCQTTSWAPPEVRLTSCLPGSSRVRLSLRIVNV